MFYVEFFGPSVEHAWVAEGGLIEYKGIEAFKTYAQDQVDQAPTKSQKEKLAERFQLKVALTRRDYWEQAVEEADEAMNKKLNEPLTPPPPPLKQIINNKKESINNKQQQQQQQQPPKEANKVGKRKVLIIIIKKKMNLINNIINF